MVVQMQITQTLEYCYCTRAVHSQVSSTPVASISSCNRHINTLNYFKYLLRNEYLKILNILGGVHYLVQ